MKTNQAIFFFLSFFFFHFSFFTFSLASIGERESKNYVLPLKIEEEKGSVLGRKSEDYYQQQFDSQGYTTKEGLSFIYTHTPFSFSVSDLILDMGILSPEQPATASSQLIIATGSAGGYSVSAYENSSLKTPDNSASIPDTSCNYSQCTRSLAQSWTDNTAYGFGFNLKGDNTALDFETLDFYRPFANKTKGQPAQIIIAAQINVPNPPSYIKKTTISLKVNVSTDQKVGKYANSINLLALPNY